MKKTIALICLGIPLLSCSSGNSSSGSSQTTPLINITSVAIGQMDGDTQPSEFSTLINFTNNSSVITNWQFGFYMARTFDTVVTELQSVNPDLVMQICTESSPANCVGLTYQQASAITVNDLSAGYTTVLAPASNFTLEPGASYVIKLLHNNQWNPGNYSAIPQNFFISSGNTVSNIPTTTSTYQLIDYDAASVNQQITEQIDTNWTNSNGVTSAVNLIPSPVSYAITGESYTLQSGLVIHNVLNNDNTVANFFRDDLASDLSITATVDNQSGANTGIIINEITDSSLIDNNPEGYRIIVTANAINIYALNNTGALYALQTLRQLWNQSATIPGASITDYPRFKYRGILLDTARHFFTLPEIESLVNIALIHKLNTLHVHFSDDEGMRLGLSGYPTIPTLADTRGYGNSITALMFIQANLDTTNFQNLIYPLFNTSYSGTYSLADLQELVSYANQRGITVIPEIDSPGHARAMIKAFPDELVDPNDHAQFISVQGYTDDVLPVCTYNTDISVGPKFTPLFNNIFNQLADIFNNQNTLYAISKEVSVGGDEVSNGAWADDSSCTGEWLALDALGKSHKFFELFAAQNTELKISGWQQYIQTESAALGIHRVPANQSGHVWIWNNSISGPAQAKTLAEAGYPVVLDYSDQNYFDLAYTPAVTEPGFTWATPYSDTQASLSSAISASNTISQIDVASQQNILGMEGTLWAENLASYDHMIYMALPKMAGLSEASWSPAAITTANNQPNWQSLVNRLGCGQTGFLNYLSRLYGVHYRGYPNGIALEVPSAVCSQ